MSGTAPAPSRPGRVSTGNAALDTMLEGGLLPGRPYLIVGPAGTGKTTLALEFLCEGVRAGERVLLVTLEEPPNEARWNHRGLEPQLDQIDVFDAIPDVMRYERTPFKDIAAVRAAVPFANVTNDIRRTPELTSVEVTITALEQMLRSETLHRDYTRIVIDSLTALQYFCMKGFDPVAGAQSFLRFLSDLRVTTILTVEAPLEDVESPERMLARGEIRLFRWELNDYTVRAIGVEKFRGSGHDARLHPYRLGAAGLDINLEVTISRDSRRIVAPSPEPALAATAGPTAAELLAAELHDLLLVGADISAIRTELLSALAAARRGEASVAENHLGRAVVEGAVIPEHAYESLPTNSEAEAALARIQTRADASRGGMPPLRAPGADRLVVDLARILDGLPQPPTLAAPSAPPETTLAAPPAPPVAAAAPVPEAPGPTSAAAEPPGPVTTDLPAPLVPAAGPATRGRAAPPPLPRAPTLPEHATPGLGSLETASMAVGPGPSETATPSAAAKRRKRAPPRKKSAVAPEPPAPEAGLGESGGPAPTPPPSGPVGPPVEPPAAESPALVPAPARPKRRVVRKKKAPTVVGAMPGPAPPAEGPSPSPSAPPEEASPKEGS